MHPKVLTFRGEPIIGKTSVKPINELVFSKSANCRRLWEWSAVLVKNDEISNIWCRNTDRKWNTVFISLLMVCSSFSLVDYFSVYFNIRRYRMIKGLLGSLKSPSFIYVYYF